MKRVITISGLHGTGKTSVANRIAEEFGLRIVSVGSLFRSLAKERGLTLEQFSRVAEHDASIDRILDDRLKQEAEKGDVVLDGQLAAWMAGDAADFRVLLTAPPDIRHRRISDRDGIGFEQAKSQTTTREKSERARYHKLYGIKIEDQSVYDLVLNTGKYDLEGVIVVVVGAIRAYFVSERASA
ncbi:MAG: cytidylate kinase [Candidatus Thorarchaeota archaeon]|nr:MAG: cytidylate kinase [Candidatus Thorarchaeota archaeon]